MNDESEERGLLEALLEDRYAIVAVLAGVLLIVGAAVAFIGPSLNVAGQPVDVKGSVAGDVVTITWSAPAGEVAGYNIYRSSEKDKLGDKLNPSILKETSYTDKPGIGKYYYTVRAISNGGVEEGNNNQIEIIVAGIKPSALSITINPSPYTNNEAVSLVLSAENAKECRYSNDDGVWSDYEPYVDNKNWTLTAGEGKKTVSYQCRNSGVESEVVSATTTVDYTAPEVSFGVEMTNSVMKLYAAISDNSKEEVSCSVLLDDNLLDSFSADGEYHKEYAVSLSAGEHKVLLNCKDAAGNEKIGMTTVSLEAQQQNTTKKNRKITIKINNGAAETDDRAVTLNLFAEEADQCRYKNEGASWTPYENYDTVKSWLLSQGTGLKYVFYECKDKDGVSIGTASDSIKLVRTATNSNGGSSSSGGSGGGGGQQNNNQPSITGVALLPKNDSFLVTGYTNNTQVIMEVNASGVDECRYRQTPALPMPAWSDYEPYVQQQPYTLTPTIPGLTTDGERKVEVECRNATTGDSVVGDASIIYDSTKPNAVEELSRADETTWIYKEEVNGTNYIRVLLTWNKPMDNEADVYKYVVYRKVGTAPTVEYATMLEDGTSLYKFNDTVDENETYMYFVVTYDKANNWRQSEPVFCDSSGVLPKRCTNN